MFGGTFFKPKWQHRKAEVRRTGVLELNPEQPESQQIFLNLARQDLDREVRQLALKRLNAVPDLIGFLGENDQQIAAAASKRFLQQLSRPDLGDTDIQAVDRFLASSKAEDLLETIAKQASSETLRLRAMLQLDRQTVYADRALNDDSPQIRAAALARITKVATLDRIAKQSRRQDKQIFALAQARLDELRADVELPVKLTQQATELLTNLTAILQVCGESQTWLPSQQQIAGLAAEWQAIQTLWRPHWPENPLKLYITQAFGQLESEMAAERQQKVDLQTALAADQPILDALEAGLCRLLELQQLLTAAATPLPELQRIFAAEQQLWQSPVLVSGPGERKRQILNERYQALGASLSSSLQQYVDFQKCERRYDKLIQDINATLAKETPVTLAAVEKYKQRRLAIAFPAGFPLDPNRVALFTQQMVLLEQRMEQQAAQLANNKRLFAELIKELADALATGKAKHAVNLFRRCEKLFLLLVDSKGFDSKNKLVLDYLPLKAQALELQDWRNWSNAPIKERLCLDVENMLQDLSSGQGTGQIQYSKVMDELRAYQQEWRTLSHTESRSDKVLWERFDAACQQVAAACQIFFDDRDAERRQILIKRRAYCEELETYARHLQQKDANDIDWKGLDKVLRVAQQEWHQLGTVDITAKESIQERFKNAIAELKRIQQIKRTDNEADKQRLVTQVEALLVAVTNKKISLAEAVDKVKANQLRWKTIGVANNDKTLWLAFQAACNAVFDRLGEQRREVQEQYTAAANQLLLLCEQVEGLLTDSQMEPKKTQHRFEELRQAWGNAADESAAKGLQKRFDKACRAVEAFLRQRQGDLQGRRQQASIVFLRLSGEFEAALRLALAENVLAQNIDAGDIRALQSKLESALTEVTDNLSKSAAAYVKRGQKLLDAMVQAADVELRDTDLLLSLSRDIEKTSATVSALRQRLCLALEILAEIPSPAAYQQARLAYQISILAEQMRQARVEDKWKAAEVSINDWLNSQYLLHPEGEGLLARILTALEAIIGPSSR